MNFHQSVWRRYEPSTAMPWNLKRAKHLYRRAGFGATWSELQQAVDSGPEKAVDRMVAGGARSYAVPDDFEDISEILGDAAVSSDDPRRLQAWWLYRMLFTPDPLQEQLALMWHNHFATSNLKVRSLSMMRDQNELFRRDARASFGDLLRRALADQALLTWLDAESNCKESPNENLARELLELFTLGIGNYTEADVQQAARALSGWTVDRKQAVFRPDRHDGGFKTILGVSGNHGVEQLVALLLDQDATSVRIAWRLCDHFMGERTTDEAIQALASGLRDHDLSVDWAVRTMLHSELFFRDENIATQVRSPVNHVVGTVRSLQLLDPPPSTVVLAEWCKRLGQELFYPPSVGGWRGGRSWLTSRTIVARSNFADAMMHGRLRYPPDPPTFDDVHQALTTRMGSFEKLLLCRPAEDSERSSDSEPLNQMGIAKLLSLPEALLN